MLGERAEGLLVLLQTAIVAVAAAGTFASLRLLGWLRDLELGEAAASELLGYWPSSYVAAAIADAPAGAPSASNWLPIALALGGALCIAVVPPAAEPRGRSSLTPLARFLAPVRALAARLWVRDDERASFHLVLDALLDQPFLLQNRREMLGQLDIRRVGSPAEEIIA